MSADLPAYFFPLLWAGLVMLVIGLLGAAAPRRGNRGGRRRWWMAVMSLSAAICVGAALCLALRLRV